MHASKSLSRLALIALSSTFLTACDPAVIVPEPDFAHQSSDITVDERVVYGKLENGMRYAVLSNDTPKQEASIRLYIDTGSLNETDDIQGVSHFLEHMAFNGSDKFPEGEMVKQLERFGLAFGAHTNAYTSFDETVYMLDLPEVTEEIFDLTLGVMRETASNLTLAAEAIDRERGVVQSEKRRQDSPGFRAQLASLDFYLGESRIPSRLPIGDDEDLEIMTAEQFRAYYDGHYRPENAFMVIVGDVDTDFASKKIAEYFSDWTGIGETLPEFDAGTSAPQGIKVGYFTDPDIQTSLSLSLMRPYVERPDTIENRRLGLIEGLGNTILSRRLSTLARQPEAVFISGGADTSELYGAAEITSLTMSSQQDSWEQALATGEQELRRALAYGFTQAELDEQLANIRKSLEVSVQTADTRRTPSLASSLINSFSSERVFSTPASGLERYESYATDITPDLVWGAFKVQWEGVDKPLLYLQTPKVIDAPEQTVQAAWEASRSVEVSPPQQIETQEFAYTDFGAPGETVSRSLVEGEDIHQIKFANNVMLNVKKTDFDKESLQITAQFGGGFLSLPLDNPNTQHFASYVISAGGLEAHSTDDLQRILAGKAVGSSFGIGTDAFSISGATVPGDIRDQLNLMMAYLTAPGYRPEAKARFEKQVESWYPTLDSTPSGVASRDIGRLINSGDERFGYPSEAAFMAITANDVKTWLSPHFETGRLEISVIGDVDVEQIITEVAATFGTLPERETKVPSHDDARKLVFPQPRRRPVTLSHAGEDNRSLIRVYWPAPDGTDVLRSRRIGVLQRIFQNSLTEVIREEEAASYSPSASRYSPENYPGYGYMAVSLDLDPSDVDAMFVKVDEIAETFRTGNISQDQFDRAMTPVLEGIERSLETNGYWMGVIANSQTDLERLEQHRSRVKAYQDMTLSDIKPLAAQIFKSDTAYRVQVLPEK